MKWGTGLALIVVALSGQAFSQQVTFAMAASAAMAPPPMVVTTIQPEVLSQEPAHKFWDRKNKLLFAAAAASNAADFAVTYSNLQNGGKELNPVTRVFAGSTAGLAANFAGETAGVVGLSYFFHKTGHHKLERLTSIVNISSSSFAVGYSLSHR
ncbi:MAG TPA: hypothetical protein VFJ47_02670 [Terriglobales bacterium]|nr:hypothetical protein [Terriglobales bacterium]